MAVSRELPRDVWVLGIVSLLMDASSELIHSLLPVFMVASLGASPAAVGVVEGIAEATASIVKVFSGTLSDYLGRRKELAVLGYGLAAASKPLFALAGSVQAVLGARFIDRVGKGMRGSPRDALIADITPPAMRGAAYGLRQALDTVGAFLGPLLAIALMAWSGGRFRPVFWLAAAPAALAVLLLAFGVRESKAMAAPSRPRTPISLAALGELGSGYWWIVGVGSVLALARFSEAFLILRARDRGLADGLAPAVYVLMNVVYAACAYPAGKLADVLDRRGLLLCGLASLVAADVTLGSARTLTVAGFGVALWGLQMALTQGLLSALVADAAPAELRGTAFGVFNLCVGVAALAASVLAGVLWDRLGAPATFYAGAALAALSLALIALRGRRTLAIG